MKRLPILLFFSILAISICSAKTITLTGALLKQASEVTYYCSNGAVAPEYQFSCYVIVTKTSVRLLEYYAGNTSYDNTVLISSTKYTEFINNLVKQQIYYNDKDYDDFIPLCGGGNNLITVKKDDSTLFKGDTWEVLKVDNGNLYDAFVKVMPKYMAQQFLEFIGGTYSDSDATDSNLNTDSIVNSIINKLRR